MQNLNEQNIDKKTDPTPLGLEEMNSVIKSFQDSSFNTEELYKKDENVFVKKTLYDLAIESEKKISDDTSDIDIQKLSSENISKELVGEASKNSSEDEKESVEVETDLKEKKLSTESNDKEKIDNNESNEEKDETLLETKDTNDKNYSEEPKTNNISDNDRKQNFLENGDDDLSSKNQKSIDDNFEDDTLEALDSVRNAVSKSLDKSNDENPDKNNEILDSKTENYDQQNKIIEKIQDDYSAIVNLFDKIKDVSVNEIENLIKEKVIKISSEVVGYQIDKLPQKFVDKIKSELIKLTKSNDEIIVYLNKEDLSSVNKIKAKIDFGKKFKFEEKEKLNRGDFLIQASGLDHLISYTLEQK